jgi:hypothetical protein
LTLIIMVPQVVLQLTIWSTALLLLLVLLLPVLFEVWASVGQ